MSNHLGGKLTECMSIDFFHIDNSRENQIGVSQLFQKKLSTKGFG